MGRLVVCASCKRHVREGSAGCPHCDRTLVIAPSKTVRREVRRVVSAVAMGLGVACGTPLTTPGPTQQLPSASDPLVVGDCATDGGPQSLACDVSCGCGSNGLCQPDGGCVNCGCDAGTHCFGSEVGQCSTHTCYGSPPLLA
jgi:hypothetical protein